MVGFPKPLSKAVHGPMAIGHHASYIDWLGIAAEEERNPWAESAE